MSSVVVDTHAIIWSLFQPHKLSAPAQQALSATVDSGAPIYVATITLVEIRYLMEKGKIPSTTLGRLEVMLDMAGSPFALAALDRAVAREVHRISRTEVPDMPDRIIAATAWALNLPLITRDRKIRSAAIHTIW
jgi:PIN domain nuclease of toxin-antitoxin system